METIQLCLNCLLWPFSSVIVSSDESGSTMLHSLELSAVPSSAVLVTIAGRLLCSLLIPGKPCGCGSFAENTVIASATAIALLPENCVSSLRQVGSCYNYAMTCLCITTSWDFRVNPKSPLGAQSWDKMRAVYP